MTDVAEFDDDPAGGEEHAPPRAVVKRAFGEANRNRLIEEFLTNSDDPPWLVIYKLLLWIDKTIGLAHCYESDKCQPGKNWHERALRFHDWLAQELRQPPGEIGDSIDWLFRHVAEDYAHFMVGELQKRLAKAVDQRAAFAGRGFPEPGDDPALVEIIREVLGDRLTIDPTVDEWRELTQRIRSLIAVENKRKNIVGEGFEDAITAVLRRFDVHRALQVSSRKLIYEIPGFANRRLGDKPPEVDVAIVRHADGRRVLVSAKWSIRADREEQFRADYQKYLSAESANETFEYVWITNEFDPARLKRACESNAGNGRMFTSIVHIKPAAIQAVYGGQPTESTMRAVLNFIQTNRIIGIDTWLANLVEA